jgi:hypothetical protein
MVSNRDQNGMVSNRDQNGMVSNRDQNGMVGNRDNNGRRVIEVNRVGVWSYVGQNGRW